MEAVKNSYKPKTGEVVLIHSNGNCFAFSSTHAYRLMIKKDNGGWKYRDKPGTKTKNANTGANTGTKGKASKSKPDKESD